MKISGFFSRLKDKLNPILSFLTITYEVMIKPAWVNEVSFKEEIDKAKRELLDLYAEEVILEAKIKNINENISK